MFSYFYHGPCLQDGTWSTDGIETDILYEPEYNLHKPEYNLHELEYNLHEPSSSSSVI